MDSNQVAKTMLRTVLVFIVAVLAVIVWRASVSFSGSVWAWTAIVCGIAALAIGLYSLICQFRKPNA